MQAYRERAFTLLRNDDAKNAFDIAKEPATVRDRYGRNKFADASEFLNSHVRRLTVYLLD